MTWLAFVAGAVLSWGVYGAMLHQGQVRLGSPMRALLCVGVAYFLAVVVGTGCVAAYWASPAYWASAYGSEPAYGASVAYGPGLAQAGAGVCGISAVGSGSPGVSSSGRPHGRQSSRPGSCSLVMGWILPARRGD